MKKLQRFSLFLLCGPLFLLACQNNFINSDSFSSFSNDSSNSETSSISSESSESDSSSEEPLPTMSKAEVLNALSASPFKTKMTSDADVALNNLANVGIDEDKLYNEELYPVPEKTSSVHIYSAKDDVGMFYGAPNNAGTLSNFINEIKNIEGIKIIEFEDITYDMKAAVNIEGIQDLYLVGKEHTLFELEGWGSYLIATSCTNLHLNNIQFDMKYSPTISGVISSFTESDDYTDVVLDVPNEFDMTYEGYRNFDPSSVQGQCSYMECYYDSETGRYVPDLAHNLYFNSSTSTDNYGVQYASVSQGKMTVRLSHSFAYCSYHKPVIGTHVSFAFTMYQNFGLSFNSCEELYLENTNLYVCGGMGIHFSGGKNIYMNRANFRCKEGSQRIMTCTADIVHSVTVENDLKITNCILEASHDDALNIKMWYANIGEASKIQSKYLIRQGSQTPGTKFEVGDVIELIDKTTMQRMKSFQITESEKVGANYEVKVKGLNGSKIDPDTDVNYMVANDTKATHLYLHNCLIQHKRNRGILLQCRYSEISNCCFRNVVHGSIQILGISDSFGEAILPSYVDVKDNKFISCRNVDVSIFSYGSSGHGVPGNIHHINVINNYFHNSYNHSIKVRAASDVIVSHNLMHSISKTNGQYMHIMESKDCAFEHNKFIVSNGEIPDSILAIEGELENITDYENTAEIFN